MTRDLLDGRTLAEWISRLDPSLGEFTVETLESGFTDEKEAYVLPLNRSTISAIAALQAPQIIRNAIEVIC